MAFRIQDVGAQLEFDDPDCKGSAVRMKGWHIFGMRTVGKFVSATTGRQFYGDLPAGHGIVYPTLMCLETAEVFGEERNRWFARSMRTCYLRRNTSPVEVREELFGSLDRPLILNCLDYCFGHSLLKLFNATRHLRDDSDKDLILLIPENLRWLCPRGAAAIWTVKEEGVTWNENLDKWIKNRLADAKQIWCSHAVPHPPAQSFAISAYSGVEPFGRKDWFATKDPVKIVFSWRDDRTWGGPDSMGWKLGTWWRLRNRIGRRVGRTLWQAHLFRSLLDDLRTMFDALEVSVIGIASASELPSWVSDLRAEQPTEEVERAWVRRCAESHLVIGIHGSNMLLPTAHAGGSITLMPRDRWRNLIQDNLSAETDPRLFSIKNVAVTSDISVDQLGHLIGTIIERVPNHILNYTEASVDFAISDNDKMRMYQKMAAQRAQQIRENAV